MDKDGAVFAVPDGVAAAAEGGGGVGGSRPDADLAA